VGGAERIERAFSPLGESRQSTPLAQGADAITAACEDLVWIRLMPDVPDQDVARRVEYVVQSDCQFDHPEPCSQVTTGLGHRVNRLAAEFVRQLAQLRQFESTGVDGCVDGIQQWSG